MAGADRKVITSSQAPQPLGAYSLGISVSPGKLSTSRARLASTPTATWWAKATPQPRPGKHWRTSVMSWPPPERDSATLSSSLPTWSAARQSRDIWMAAAKLIRRSTLTASSQPTPSWWWPAWSTKTCWLRSKPWRRCRRLVDIFGTGRFRRLEA